MEEEDRIYETCSQCGNNTFYVFKDKNDPIGTYEECSYCNKR